MPTPGDPDDRAARDPAPPPAAPSTQRPPAPVPCPACGTANAPDAVFCASPGCHKALGEFRYVREELAATTAWHERAAERVTAFVGRPHYAVVHAAWFVGWIALNSGLMLVGRTFDAYPYNLLGILIAIEAIFLSGFVLVSQNRQAAHADKRAELDYEVNVRTYREIREIRDALRALDERVAALDAAPRG